MRLQRATRSEELTKELINGCFLEHYFTSGTSPSDKQLNVLTLRAKVAHKLLQNGVAFNCLEEKGSSLRVLLESGCGVSLPRKKRLVAQFRLIIRHNETKRRLETKAGRDRLNEFRALVGRSREIDKAGDNVDDEDDQM